MSKETRVGRRRLDISDKSIFVLVMFSLLMFAAATQVAEAADYTKVGVTVGNSADYTMTGTVMGYGVPSGAASRMTVTSVSGTVVNISLVSLDSNGNPVGAAATVSGDISKFALSMIYAYVICPDLAVGDQIFSNSPIMNITSSGTYTVAGASRTLDNYTLSYSGLFENLAWDKATGVMVSLSISGLSGNGQVTMKSTNMWGSGAGSGSPTSATTLELIALVAVAVVVIVAVVAIVLRRRK